MNYLDTALEWNTNGFNVVPVKENKSPAVPSWTRWQTEAQTEEEIRAIFAGDHYGIALICGFNNVEVIDVDAYNDKDGNLLDNLKEELNESPYNLIKDYAYATTRSGGAHLIYRCSTPPPGNNPKLARKDGKAIIETRGSGGYALIAPSPGYTMYRKEVLVTSMLFPEERTALMDLCGTFNEDYSDFKEYAQPPTPDSDTRPGTIFSRDHGRAEVVSMLERHGWSVAYERGPQVQMVRPGKSAKDGWSGNWHDEKHKFYCFSPNAQPLQPRVAYDPFALLTLLEYGGDWRAAAIALGGTKVTTPQQRIEQQIESGEDKWADAFVYNPYEDDGTDDEEWVIQYETNNASYPFLGRGHLLSLGGMEKSRKSRFLYTLAAGGITGKPLLGFRWVQPPRKILLFDTEQPKFWIKRAGRGLTKTVGNKDWADILTFHSIRNYSDAQRLDYIEEKLYLARKEGQVDMIIIDGLADLIDDFNDLGKSVRTINRLMTMQESSIMAGVIHLNRGKDNAYERGHLGSIWTKKSDSIVRITYDESTMASTVTNYRSRTIPFPEFDFTQDRSGNVVLNQPIEGHNYRDL